MPCSTESQGVALVTLEVSSSTGSCDRGSLMGHGQSQEEVQIVPGQ